MGSQVRQVYKCYLGRNRWTRAHSIISGIGKQDLKPFFQTYSTKDDSILDFIKRGEGKGLSYFL